MEITDVPFAVLRFQYQLARFPLQLIEKQVVAGMSSEAPTRVCYERWLGGLDATVHVLRLEPRIPRHVLALEGEAVRRRFEEYLDARDPHELRADVAATLTKMQLAAALRAAREWMTTH